MYKLKSLKIKNIISFREQTFQFRNGKAILIVGNNMDDSAQRGNGSGKSALIEATALAFTGTSIRDVKAKELIYNGNESGEVELLMESTITGDTFKIWRKIYSGSKSSEYRSWLNDKEQSDRYSDFNTFNDFVWLTIGISKEDFFSFFLITKENYNPFLIIGDTKKKEIINRFSGADKVDLAFPLIEEDSNKLADEILLIEKELLQNTTKQELLSEQYEAAEKEVSDEAKNKLIDAKILELDILVNESNAPTEEVIVDFKAAIETANKNLEEHKINTISVLEPFIDEVELADLEVQAFEYSQNFNAALSLIVTDKSKIELDISAKKFLIPKVKDQFKTETDKITTDEADIKQSLLETEKELRENEKFESDVNKQLLDSIECPKCHHHFSLKDKCFNYEEAKLKLPEVQATIAEYKEIISDLKIQLNVDIQERKSDINQKVIKAGENIKSEIEILNQELVLLGSKELSLNQQFQKEKQAEQVLINNHAAAKNKLTAQENIQHNTLQLLQNNVRRCELNLKQKEQELKSHNEQVALLTADIEKLKSQELDKTKLEKLTKELTALIKLEEGIKIRLENKQKEKAAVDAWDVNFKGFKSHLANQSIKNIQDYTNIFLESMGSNLAINIDGYRTMANKKLKEQITTSVLRDGFDAGSYGKFSGGERGRIDICVIIAMQELISLNSPHGGIDLLIADEILESIDEMGMENIIKSLQSLQKTIMLVSQNSINNLDEFTLTVQKQNKVSTILN